MQAQWAGLIHAETANSESPFDVVKGAAVETTPPAGATP